MSEDGYSTIIVILGGVALVFGYFFTEALRRSNELRTRLYREMEKRADAEDKYRQTLYAYLNLTSKMGPESERPPAKSDDKAMKDKRRADKLNALANRTDNKHEARLAKRMAKRFEKKARARG